MGVSDLNEEDTADRTAEDAARRRRRERMRAEAAALSADDADLAEARAVAKEMEELRASPTGLLHNEVKFSHWQV